MLAKNIQVSGFFYNPTTEQILLHQKSSREELSTSWEFLSGDQKSTEDPREAFKRLAQAALNIKLALSQIRTVYDYNIENKNKEQFIVYVETTKVRIGQKTASDYTSCWFTFRQLHKLPMTEQTSHDIEVAKRVIKAKVRQDEGQVVVKHN